MSNSYFPPLLWLGVIFAGPIEEELLFRGFLFEGIRNSKLKNIGAVIFTSLVWALMHSQYDISGIFIVFLCGLFLGFSRVKSNSINPPIIIHVIHNAISTIKLIVYLRYFQS
ncbi:MAG: CPBP family intramembrane metalloprotease [Sedimentisphaerales bacterium]|nr:CPBP family intramembrane metalloprotease [Sedimentisphaerales bacterium]